SFILTIVTILALPAFPFYSARPNSIALAAACRIMRASREVTCSSRLMSQRRSGGRLPTAIWKMRKRCVPIAEGFIPSTHNVRMMIGLTRIDFRLPDELVEKTDILAKLEYKNRTETIKSALAEYLRRVEITMQLKEKAVESYLNDKLTYNELAAAIGRQNAESVKVGKRLLERSNRIAEDIARG
ncbi:MAG: hypothetical protein GWP10_06385, partial [Nitrospiraceae bacterium]|nr:hypothetical protein [Nitrospiraceae bacterium]